MEYVNINALSFKPKTPQDVLRQLLDKFGSTTPEDTVMATDDLEIIRGHELVEASRRKGECLLPLRRVGLIKETTDFPKRVLLELTSDCNSFCFMCPRHVLKRPWCHMETALAKKIIGELAEGGLSGLWLYHIGESLLHPDFFEILKFCRQFPNLGTLWLSTNGEIMDDSYQRRLLECPVDILNYSVNAMTEESFKKITPKLHFERVQGNLSSLTRLKKELKVRKPFVRAQMMEIPYMAHEIEMLKKVHGPYIDMISINKLELFSQNITGFSDGPDKVLNTSIPRCNRLERQDFFIVSDGSVTCCDTDFNCQLNIGNIKDQSIREIVKGKKYQALLERYRSGLLHEIEPCCRCRDFNL